MKNILRTTTPLSRPTEKDWIDSFVKKIRKIDWSIKFENPFDRAVQVKHYLKIN